MFQVREYDAEVPEIAALCYEAGIPAAKINSNIFEVKTHARFKIERHIFDTLEFFADGAIAVSIILQEDIQKAGAAPTTSTMFHHC